MRAYQIDSPEAAGRILALSMIVDGNLDERELAALDRSKVLGKVALDQPGFQQLIQDLCDDLVATAAHGSVQLEPSVIDGLLGEIASPDLRRQLLQAMWAIADADDWLADGEAVLLARASVVWAAETNFCNRDRKPVPV